VRSVVARSTWGGTERWYAGACRITTPQHCFSAKSFATPLTNTGSLTTAGTFTNNRTLTNSAGATLSNSGTLTNAAAPPLGALVNNGTLTNLQQLNNLGIFTNNGTLANNLSASVTNSGFFTNTGNVVISASSTFSNGAGSSYVQTADLEFRPRRTDSGWDCVGDRHD
jgi:hypothetical protein